MDIQPLTTLHLKRIHPKTLIFTKKTRLWCTLPYPNHPHGCPNFDKNKTCPHQCDYMDYIIDHYQYFYLMYAIFDFGTYLKTMKQNHPEWTDRQCRCVLYWQNSVKKLLRDKWENIQKYNRDMNILSCGAGFGKEVPSMEAGGINVMMTMKKNNIDFEVKPKTKIVLMCLLYSNNKLKMPKKSKPLF